MADQFGYTPVTSTVGEVVVTKGRLKGIGQDLNKLLEAVGTYKKVKSRETFYSASDKYRERQEMYRQGVDQVKHDPEAYSQHLENFKSDVVDLGKTLEGADRNTFLNSANNYLMYQDMGLNSSQERARKYAFDNKMSLSAHMFATLDASETVEHMSNLREEGKALGISAKDIESSVFSEVDNIKLISATGEDTTIENLDQMLVDFETREESFPMLKGKRGHEVAKGRIRALREGLVRIEKAKYEEAYKLGDEETYQQHKENMITLGVFDKERAKLEEANFYKKEISSDKLISRSIDTMFTATKGRLRISNFDGKGKTLLTKMIKHSIERAFVGQDGVPDLATLKWNSIYNKKQFKQTFKEITSTSVASASLILSDPNATQESKQRATHNIQTATVINSNLRNALEGSEKKELFIANAIMALPNEESRRQAWVNYNTPAEVVKVESDNEDLVIALVDITNVGDKITAKKQFEELLTLGIDAKTASETVKGIFTSIEVGDTKLHSSIQELLPSNPAEYEKFTDGLEYQIYATGDKQLHDNYKKLIDEGATISSLDVNHIQIRGNESGRSIILRKDLALKASNIITTKSEELRDIDATTTTYWEHYSDVMKKVGGEGVASGVGYVTNIAESVKTIIEAPGKAIGAVEEQLIGAIWGTAKQAFKELNGVMTEAQNFEPGSSTPKLNALKKKVESYEEDLRNGIVPTSLNKGLP